MSLNIKKKVRKVTDVGKRIAFIGTCSIGIWVLIGIHFIRPKENKNQN